MFKNRTILENATLLEALKKMDILNKKLLIVLGEDNKFIGLLSVGDIQRAIINNISLDTNILIILREDIRIAKQSDNFEVIRKMMFDFRMELCPVIGDKDEVIRVYFWEDVFGEQRQIPVENFDIPIIIMAGGMGKRLRPLTNVLPKPLIPIGNKTIIEHIFQQFAKYGNNNFFVSVNYKAELIEFYLRNQNLPYKIEFFKEDKPLGTGGSLSLLKGKIDGSFFVSNCDIIIYQDYSEILKYHRENKNEITIVAALKSYPIPYGIIKTDNNGNLTELTEKPEFTFLINSGMYLLESHVLEEIPNNEFFHITSLIEKISYRNGNIGVFPVSDGSWRDIGEWNEYLSEIKSN